VTTINTEETAEEIIPEPAAAVDPVYEVTVDELYASSFLPNSKNEYRYHMSKAFDNNPLTSWVEGTRGPGINEYLEIYFNEIITADVIKIMPGYYDEKWYTANNRVKELRILLDNYEINTQLTDGMNLKEIILDKEIQFQRARFIIRDIYRGTEYDDTCIAEIKFYIDSWSIDVNPNDQMRTAFLLDYPENSPLNKYYIEDGMDCYCYYFFPDGKYVYYSGSVFSGLPSDLPRETGSWEYNSITGIIEMNAELEIYIKRSGSYFEEIDSQAGESYYEFYEYTVEEINGLTTLDWFECLNNSKNNQSFYIIDEISEDLYSLLDTEITDSIISYIEEHEEMYSHYLESMHWGDGLPPYIEFYDAYFK
jgi:hypothetical protein